MSDAFDDGNSAPRKEGMSSAMKIILVLGILVGVMCLACCGGMFWIGNKAANSVSMEPARVQEIASGILDMQVPPQFPSMMAMDMTVMGAGARMAQYGNGHDTTLMVMELVTPDGQMPPNAQVNNQAQAVPFTKSVEQKMQVNGADARFEIGTATNNGQEIVQVSGSFKSKGKKPCTLLLMIPSAQFSEEKALEFVRSLGTPQGDATVRIPGPAVEAPAVEVKPDAEAAKPEPEAANAGDVQKSDS